MHTCIVRASTIIIIPMQMYQFRKAKVPEDAEEKLTFSETLLKFGISLMQYEKAYCMDEITM